MAKPTGKIKLDGLHGQRNTNAAVGQRSAPAVSEKANASIGTQAQAQAQASVRNSSANAKSSLDQTRRSSAKAVSAKTKNPLLPGGAALWLLLGLAVGLGGWLGGRTYLRRLLADRLSQAQSEQAAIESIDALLRLDANATIEVTRGLGHPQFPVANAAFRALGGQLEAWAQLEAADRLQRMQQVVAQLERLPSELDQDHRILVSGLASRIYADTLSHRESGAAQVLDACRRVIVKSDPAAVGARLARLQHPGDGPNLARDAENLSPVPPPLPPLNPDRSKAPSTAPSTTPPPIRPLSDAATPIDAPQSNATTTLDALSDSRSARSANRSSMPRMSLSDSTSNRSPGQASLHLTAGTARQPLEPPQIAFEKGPLAVEPAPQLAEDSSSRPRAIPRNIVPLTDQSEPSPEELARQAAQTISGMDELRIDQLVRLLSSLQPRISQAAALTLRQRGMCQRDLEMAIELASGSAQQRSQLLTQLAALDDIDPRPWLLWMATDGQDSVRLHAVALLEPLVDQDVRRELRLLLNKERNEQVASTIRSVLAR